MQSAWNHTFFIYIYIGVLVYIVYWTVFHYHRRYIVPLNLLMLCFHESKAPRDSYHGIPRNIAWPPCKGHFHMIYPSVIKHGKGTSTEWRCRWWKSSRHGWFSRKPCLIARGYLSTSLFLSGLILFLSMSMTFFDNLTIPIYSSSCPSIPLLSSFARYQFLSWVCLFVYWSIFPNKKCRQTDR